LGQESKVPKGVKYIPEIVINGTSMEAVKQAIKAGIQGATEVDGVVKISAGNYGGKLGKHKISLKELLP
jgi:formylmethanofuran--tetrahydromethanopterin N-formyltransferase